MLSQHPKYNYQIIINIEDADTSITSSNSYVQHKWETIHGYNKSQCHFLSIKAKNESYIIDKPNEWQQAFSGIDHKTRIYVIGHCNAGSSSLFGYDAAENIFSITATELANLLVQYIPDAVKTVTRIHNQTLRISLLACDARKPSKYYLPPQKR